MESFMKFRSYRTPVPSSAETVNVVLNPNLDDSLITSPSSNRLSHLLHTNAICAWSPKVLRYLANSIY